MNEIIENYELKLILVSILFGFALGMFTWMMLDKIERIIKEFVNRKDRFKKS